MKKKVLKIVLYGFFILNLLCFAGYTVIHQYKLNKNQKLNQKITEKVIGDDLVKLHHIAEEMINDETGEDEKKEKPIHKKKKKEIKKKDEKVKQEQIDFNLQGLRKINKDACGWIDIPESTVQYPILRHETDNSYYLHHNIDGSSGYPGCVYMENNNNGEFTDKITVLYAHNMKNGSMFGALKKWKDDLFFNEHPYIYIYGKDVKVYEIFAAVTRNNEHLAKEYDFTSEKDAKRIFEELQETKGAKIRSTRYTKGDNIIILSTCEKEWSDNRFIIAAKELESN